MSQSRDLAEFSISYSQANVGIISKGTSGATSTPNTVYAPSSVYDVANLAFTQANSAYSLANNVAPQIQPAFNQANSAYDVANLAFNQANSAYDVANSASMSLQSVQTANFTAVAGRSYPVNTSNGAITVTFPASPTPGQQINIFDYAGTFQTNFVTINGNGKYINGVITGYGYLAQYRQSVVYTYVDSTLGWLSTTGWANQAGTYTISYLGIAGGAAGGKDGYGSRGAGGGGAGGVLSGTYSAAINTAYSFVIGAGGAPASYEGGNGSSTTLFGLTCIGGGGGGGNDGGGANHSGVAGGSGGGGSHNGSAGGSGTSGQGNSGGSNCGGGGGGGGTGNGGGGYGGTGGTGGSSLNSSITGSSVAYAGGGGSNGATAGGGGGGGAGAGGNYGYNGTSATANTGSGGGGGATAGSGGSGIVILSLPSIYYSGRISGSPTVTTSGSNTIIKFTSSGSYTA